MTLFKVSISIKEEIRVVIRFCDDTALDLDVCSVKRNASNNVSILRDFSYFNNIYAEGHVLVAALDGLQLYLWARWLRLRQNNYES